MADPSAILVWSFTALAVLVGAAFPVGVFQSMRRLGAAPEPTRRAAIAAAVGVAVWMGATLAAAASGLLTFGPFPPPAAFLLLLILVGASTLGLSRVGRRLALGLPLAALVGMQGFRFPLELIMHRAYTEGVMPVQMSYSGLNFDILTGIGALVVAALLLAGRMPRWGVWVWNSAGSLLLVNIVTIAWLSTPTPMRVFMNEPANVWITGPPFVWLPAVMVFAAILGHIIVFRRLWAERNGNAAGAIMAGLLLLASACAGDGQRSEFPANDDLETMLRYLVEDGETPGIVVGILEVDGSTRVLSHGSGGPGAQPLGPVSVFEIGSVTKTFTGTLLADMIARGEASLDDPVSRHLPDSVSVPAFEGRDITLLDLATHTSGLPGAPDHRPADPLNPWADWTVEKLYAWLSDYDSDARPALSTSTRTSVWGCLDTRCRAPRVCRCRS